MERKNPEQRNRVSITFKAGAVSLAFLIIGYQIALFVHRTSVERIASLRDHPDTVFVVDSALAARILSDSRCAAQTSGPETRTDKPAARAGGQSYAGAVTVRREASHSETVKRVREETRRVESFSFNPNTVSVPELQRLGFTEKQALAIDNYRAKGGRFRRRSDFAKSFVVSDSVFRRLEKFIDIPLVDINSADSAALDELPGIGGYFASRIVSYRKELGAYSYPEQLMDLPHFDREKYEVLADLICCGAVRDSFALWSLPVEELKKHPYVRSYQVARAIVLYRENNPRSAWTVDGLASAGIISSETAEKLSRCAIARPD